MIRVSPTEPNPTHHISLSDGINEVGLIISNVNGDAMPTAISASAFPRTALKTSTGNTQYSDLEPPWTAIAQSSWEGGRGQEDEDDITRFFDSRRLNTMGGKIILSPQETYATGYRAQNMSMPGSLIWVNIVADAQHYLAVPFTPTENYTAKNIQLFVRRRGTPIHVLAVLLCDDDGGLNGGQPDNILAQTNVDTTMITDTEGEFYTCSIDAEALTAGTKYWILIGNPGGDDENCWQVGCKDSPGLTKDSSLGTYVTSSVDLYYRVTAADVVPAKDIFFQYQQQQFLVRSAESGAPVLYMNGDMGVADANTGTLNKLIDATKSWTIDQWVGCTVIVTMGKGSNETTNWRTVVSNTGTELVVDSDWKIVHDTTTCYVITNSNTMTVIETATHGMTAPVTDVLVVNDNVYFAQGDAVAIRRGNWYNNAGTATWRWAADGTNKAEHLCSVRDASAGLQVWKSNTLDAANLKSVAVAPAVATWANMTFGTAVPFYDDNGKINSIVEYGTVKLPWVLREGTTYSMVSGVPNEIPLKEMRAAMSARNGQATLVHNIYFYFNLGTGIERYYDGDLLDMGMNRDAGLPANRQGIVKFMIGYPGKFYAAVDGGNSNYSSLLGYNMIGWHEIYRAPMPGLVINHGQFQTVAGDVPDRLWLSVGQDIIWLSFPSMAVDPSKDANVRFHHEGSLISSWIYDNLFDVTKLWNGLKLFVENVNKDGMVVEADYMVDDDTTWTPLVDVFDEAPMKEVNATTSIASRRIRYRLRVCSNDSTKTPIIKTTVMEGISRVPIKYSYTFSYRCTDDRRDLQGKSEVVTADEQFKIIDDWARNLTRLTMHSIYKRYDNINVFIDPPPSNPIEEKTEGYMDRMTLTEV